MNEATRARDYPEHSSLEPHSLAPAGPREAPVAPGGPWRSRKPAECDSPSTPQMKKKHGKEEFLDRNDRRCRLQQRVVQGVHIGTLHCAWWWPRRGRRRRLQRRRLQGRRQRLPAPPRIGSMKRLLRARSRGRNARHHCGRKNKNRGGVMDETRGPYGRGAGALWRWLRGPTRTN